jgi:MFS family permease
VNADRVASLLVRLYPRPWRERYGEELIGLILECGDGGRNAWQTRVDVLVGAGRERVVAAGLAPGASAGARAHGGMSLVLWAWALFIFAGAIVQNTSEHWRQALGRGSDVPASVAFGVLVGVAVLVALIVLAGIAVAVPRLRELVRGGGWPAIRLPIRRAGMLTVLWLVAIVGVVVWAHTLSAHQRDGSDSAYEAAFIAQALLGLAALLAWTAAAIRIQHRLTLAAVTLRIQGRLSVLAAAGMGVMSLATGVWWVALAARSPGALTGSHAPSASAAVPQLVVAGVIMLCSALAAAFGARHTTRALPELASE